MFTTLIKGGNLPLVADLSQFSAVVFPHDFSGLLRVYLSPKSKYRR